MARGGINKALVHAARDALLARGLNPSIDLVRVELGNTGSKSTIQRYLKELNDSASAATSPPVNEEVLSLVNSLAERLIQQAQTSVAEEREAVGRQQAGYAQERAQLRERLEQSLTTISQLTHEREEQRQCERQLREQLQDSEGEHQRLRQLVAGQQKLLEERAHRVESLEEKHQNAWEGLEHYRQEQRSLRDQELRRHDEQVQQLRQELRTLQNAQLAKQEELVTVYREQERLLNEYRAQQANLRQQIQALEDCQRTKDIVNGQLQQLITEHAVLRGRVRPYLLQHREDRRQLREQARQIETLQTLLRHMSPTA
ncbi:DNA-binding protein [Pseudomonas sp. LB3P14]